MDMRCVQLQFAFTSVELLRADVVRPWAGHRSEFRRPRDSVHEAIELIAGVQTCILSLSFEDTGIE